jgi:hypothetical protein
MAAGAVAAYSKVASAHIEADGYFWNNTTRCIRL